MNSVDAGSEVASTAAMSAPSTLETNDERSRGCVNASRALVAIAGPRSEPPMPMLTTCVIRSSARMRSANAAIWSSTACTSGTTSAPSTVSRHAGRRPQRHVHHGPILGDVDVLAGEHRVASGLDAALAGQREQRLEDRCVDRLLRVVDAEVTDLDDAPVGPAGIVREQRREVGSRRQPPQRGEGIGDGVHHRRTYNGITRGGGGRWPTDRRRRSCRCA